MEDPRQHAPGPTAPLGQRQQGSSRSSINSLLNEGSGGGGGFVYNYDVGLSYDGAGGAGGVSTTSGLFTFDPDDHQPAPHKRPRQGEPDSVEDSSFSFSAFGDPSSSSGHVHLQPLSSTFLQFPSLQLHPLSAGSGAAGHLPSQPVPALASPGADGDGNGALDDERRALAEERKHVESERQKLAEERRAFELEKRKFEEEKKRWFEERDKQPHSTTTTTAAKPAISFFSRRPQAQLEEQSFGCAFVKNNAVVTKPSSKFAQAYVILQDMMTEKNVEIPLAVGIGAKDSSLPKKCVQDLGCILIPQQTRDYGPSYAKTGYLTVRLKDQKGGGAPVRIEAVEGSEGEVGGAYFVIAKGDLGMLRCIANEKEGVISNDVSGTGGEGTESTKGKRKK